MGRSQLKHFNKHILPQRGLTLIEVLIALAIVGIALTAVIKTTSQNIRSTTYLQDKTIALWVAQLVLNEARTGVVKLPDPPDKKTDEMTMLNRKWYVEASQQATANKRIEKVAVKVFRHKNEDEETPIIDLETYIYNGDKA